MNKKKKNIKHVIHRYVANVLYLYNPQNERQNHSKSSIRSTRLQTSNDCSSH